MATCVGIVVDVGEGADVAVAVGGTGVGVGSGSSFVVGFGVGSGVGVGDGEESNDSASGSHVLSARMNSSVVSPRLASRTASTSFSAPPISLRKHTICLRSSSPILNPGAYSSHSSSSMQDNETVNAAMLMAMALALLTVSPEDDSSPRRSIGASTSRMHVDVVGPNGSVCPISEVTTTRSTVSS